MPKKITVTPDRGKRKLDPSGDAKAPKSKFDRQQDAATIAKKSLGQQGAGELAIKNKQGAVRDQNTVPPAIDLRRSKG